MSENIIDSCVRQHATLVDLLIYEELRQNGWSTHATLDNVKIRGAQGNDRDNETKIENRCFNIERNSATNEQEELLKNNRSHSKTKSNFNYE